MIGIKRTEFQPGDPQQAFWEIRLLRWAVDRLKGPRTTKLMHPEKIFKAVKAGHGICDVCHGKADISYSAETMHAVAADEVEMSFKTSCSVSEYGYICGKKKCSAITY